MKTNIVIRSNGKDKFTCFNNTRNEKSDYNSITNLVEKVFENHLNRQSYHTRKLSINYLTQHISEQLNKYGDCHLEYPGDLSRGLIDLSLTKSGYMMHRVTTA